MLTISRYLLRQFLSATALVLVALLATWLAADALLHLDDLRDAGVWRELVDDALEALPLGVPMCCLVGVIWSLTRASRFREITAIRCGGIPLRRALLPLVAACGLIAIGLGVLEDRVIVKGRQRALAAEQAEEASRPRPVWKNDRFWYANGPYVLSAHGRSADGTELENVTVFELGPDRQIRSRIEAARAVFVGGNTWEFREATVYAFEGRGLQRSEALALRLDLRLSGTDIAPPPRPPQQETLHKLARRIREAAPTDKARTVLLTAFHSRLAQPFAVVILVLLAIPLATGERGDSLPRALIQALLCAVAFWVSWSLSLALAQAGWLQPPLVIWPFVGMALLIGGWRFASVAE